jgi:ACR3 family arsenite efflux pump ArsB
LVKRFGASNFFYLAVASAIALFGPELGGPWKTAVSVLVDQSTDNAFDLRSLQAS